MPHTLLELLFLINRFVHIVCMAVLIGGTLFYEMIVPAAIDDLKDEQKLHVFGLARWTFKGVVWTCAALLLISGVISTVGMWHVYGNEAGVASAHEPMMALRRPIWWWGAHAALGLLALVMAVMLTNTRRPPRYPLAWMRINLIVLLVVIFLASTARHMRLVNEGADQGIPWISGE
jgi:uncharacterized membrane protein